MWGPFRQCSSQAHLANGVRNFASSRSVDAAEVAKFNAQAGKWWDPSGYAAPLHRMNPTRVAYIRSLIESKVLNRTTAAQDERRPHPGSPLKPISGINLVDVGCGGGLVTEPMARLGANVLGVDMSAEAITVARRHLEHDSILSRAAHLRYEQAAAEDLVSRGDKFDVVLALEIVEHVAEPAQFIRDCCSLVTDGGLLVLSSLNRTALSYALGIVVAERVLQWLPRGTHSWSKFPRPEEVSEVIADDTGLVPEEVVGVAFRPISGCIEGGAVQGHIGTSMLTLMLRSFHDTVFVLGLSPEQGGERMTPVHDIRREEETYRTVDGKSS